MEISGLNLPADEDPIEFDAVEEIYDDLVSFHGDCEILFHVGLADLDPASGGRDFLAKVDLCGVVDLVVDETVELVDDHGELRGEAAEDAADAGEEIILNVTG